VLASTVIRLKALLLRARADAELDEELRYHLERETERNIAHGMAPDAARDAAKRVFGNATVAVEQARDTMRWRVVEELRQDVRYAIHAFTRAPTFVITVVATIGLGLGLLTAAFTLFEAYVLRPNAVRDPASLYDVTWYSRSGDWHRLTWQNYKAIDARRDVFTESYANTNLMSRIGGQPAVGQLVTGNYFGVLGASAALGRTLVPEDGDAPGGSPVLVISYDTWESVFGGDSAIIGRTVPLNGVPFRIVGVARRGFGGVESVPLQFWAPITMVDVVDPQRGVFGVKPSESIRVTGRLRTGITPEQASAALLSTLRANTIESPLERRAQRVQLESRATSIPLTNEAIAVFTPLAMAFVLVMLTACANIANVMLARGMARQREIGIRLSLGAARGRLIRQLLTESVVLSVPSAIAGFVISRATIAVGLYVMVADAPAAYRSYLRPLPLTTDASIVAFTMLAAVFAAVAFGLIPALQATRPSVVHATRGDFDSNLRPSKMRSALVVSQVAVSALLLICAGVLLTAARQTRGRDPGVRVHNVVQLIPTERTRSVVLDELRRLPDARSIASATRTPLDGLFPSTRAAAVDSTSVSVRFNIVSPEYFSALDLPRLRGRSFAEDEGRARANVAMVSEATARALWPNRDPIGQHLLLQEKEGGLARYHDATVIGVVRNAHPGWIGLPSEAPVVYYPQPLETPGASIIVRTSAESEVARVAIESAIASRDSSAVREAHTIDASLGLQLYPFDMAYWTAALVGGVALLLTMTGVYGVLSYVVAQRRREFGVRLALGATPAGLVRMMVAQLGRLAMIGLFIGASLAAVSARAGASIRYLVDTYDVRGFAVGIGVVFVSCLMAAWLPARGAGRVSPSETLRADS
jgi:predicted permease